MNGLVALARVEVGDLAGSLPLYQELSGARGRVFAVGDLRLAWVGPFLLLEGPAERLAEVRRAGTVLTPDVDRARRVVEEAGGTVLEPPAPGPNGARMIARHPDGSVFEYVQPDD